jgi:hypothetical protein
LSAKRFCLVPPGWDLKIFSEHSCDDRSHSHVSRSQVYEFDKHQSLEWLAIRYKKGDDFVLTDSPDHLQTWWGGIARISRIFDFRGLSATAGEYLSLAVRRRESWALAMLAQIHMRHEGDSATRVMQPRDACDRVR